MFAPNSAETTDGRGREPLSGLRAKSLRIRGTVQIVVGLGILVWPAIAVVSAFMYPSPDGNTVIEMMALIGLPLLALTLLLVGIGIGNIVRASRLSR